MEFMNAHMKRALENLTPWSVYEKSMQARLDEGLDDLTIQEASEESSPAGSRDEEEAVIVE